MSEPVFPVYSWSIRCMVPQQDFTSPYVDHYDREDCMAGWEWHHGGSSGMRQSEADFRPDEWATAIIESVRKKYGGIHCPVVTFNPIPKWETWHLSWFCHETYAPFATDEDALASFSRYVDDAVLYNLKNARMETMRDGSRYWNDSPKVLMGADDRWRWRGENEGDPPPCKCEGCRKAGMTRINH
jgi:hypothetical protein